MTDADSDQRNLLAVLAHPVSVLLLGGLGLFLVVPLASLLIMSLWRATLSGMQPAWTLAKAR